MRSIIEAQYTVDYLRLLMPKLQLYFANIVVRAAVKISNY